MKMFPETAFLPGPASFLPLRETGPGKTRIDWRFPRFPIRDIMEMSRPERGEPMETVLILLRQITLLFAFMGLGWILSKTRLLGTEGTKDLSNLVLRFVIPGILIRSFLVERTAENTRGFLLSFALSLGAILLSMGISKLVFPRRGRVIEHFGSAFSNVGFFAIPIVESYLGESAVFYIASFVMLVFTLQWTYGLYQFTRDKSMFRPLNLMKNPVLIAFFLAVFLFFTQIPVPEIVKTSLDMLSALNTPLAMIILGSYLAKMPFWSLFTDRHAYLASFVRLVLIPLVTIALFSLLPERLSALRLAVLIPAISPVGVNVAVFAGLYDQDYSQSVRLVCLSTLLSILTIPLLVTLSLVLWG